MARGSYESVKEVALLTKSIEFLIKNLVRLFVGRITLVRLQEIIELNFIREAEELIRREQPGRDVRLTNLALVTGLDTRQLSKIRNSESYRKPKHKESEFINSLTPERCIVDLWTSDSRFVCSESGQPRQLQIFGSGGSFETLVKEALRPRGITVTSALQRLVRSELVKVHEDEYVVLELPNLSPQRVRDQVGNLKTGLDATAYLLGTINENMNSTLGGGKYFQRGSWTHRLDRSDRSAFQSKVRTFLEKSDNEARSIMKPFEQDENDNSQLTAGVGFYYFEFEQD